MFEEPKKMNVTGNTQVKKSAEAIVEFLKEGKRVRVEATGKDSVNQTVKSLTLARNILLKEGMDIAYQSEIKTKKVEGIETSFIEFRVLTKKLNNESPYITFLKKLISK